MSHDVGPVFAALADPTRRWMVEHLLREGSTSVPALTSALPITRQAVAKHLDSLRDAGLVASERVGRDVRFSFDPAPLDGAVAWITAVGAKWDDRLASLEKRLKRKRGS